MPNSALTSLQLISGDSLHDIVSLEFHQNILADTHEKAWNPQRKGLGLDDFHGFFQGLGSMEVYSC